MNRKRVVKRYGAKFRSYRDFDHFLSRPARPGLHSFRHTGDLIEVLFEPGDIEPDIALVTFAAAANDKASFPKFDGQQTAKSLGVTFLGFSDPAIAYTLDVKTNWYLGNVEHDMAQTAATIIRHLAGQHKKIFFGASAGGFPALKLGNAFPDSLSFVVNPRTNLLLNPLYLNRIRQEIYPGLNFVEIDRLKGLSLPRSKNYVLLCQNLRDDLFFNNQTASFLAKNEGSEKMALRWGDWGEGHVAMPGAERISLLKRVITEAQRLGLAEMILRAGERVSTLGSVQATRQDKLDKINS